MLKLSVKPGEYLQIGEDVKVIFTGGSSNNLRVLVDAPKELNIARSRAMEKHGLVDKNEDRRYEKDRDLSIEAKEKIRAIIMEDKKKSGFDF